MWNTPWTWPRSRVTWVPLLTLWGPPAPGIPTLVHAGLGPGRGHPNFCIWWFKICGGGIDLVLIKKVPFRKSVSQTSKCFLSPNEGRLQKRCERKPALHHSGRSSRHQEGHAGCQTGQRGKWVVKTLPVHQASRAGSTRHRHLEHVVRLGFLWFRWSTEPSTARKAAMDSACLVALTLKWPRRQPSWAAR